jgi:hypothetical protein
MEVAWVSLLFERPVSGRSTPGRMAVRKDEGTARWGRSLMLGFRSEAVDPDHRVERAPL